MFEGFFDLAGFPNDSTSKGTWDIKKYFGITLPNVIYNNDTDIDLAKITQTTNIRDKKTESILNNDWKRGDNILGKTLAAKQAACESVGSGDKFEHLSSLASTEDKHARIRCGWTYDNSNYKNSRGAFGNSEGPFKPNAKGTWMWNLNLAKEKYHREICSNIKDCQDIDSKMYKQRCGWCTKSGKAVPIVNNGVAYPYNTNTTCPARQLITKGSKCPPPSALDDPNAPRGPGEVCNPLSNGALPRNCLIQKVGDAGCSDQGTLMQALKGGSDNDYTNILRQQQAFEVFQKRASAPLDATAIKTGKITISDALDNFSRVQDLASSEANAGLQAASRDLCFKRGAIDEYDFCAELQDNARSPFTLDCLQKAFLRGGGQKTGTAYPKPGSEPQWNNLSNWAAVKAKVQNIYALTKSNDRRVQQDGMMQFYGIRMQNKRNPLPYGPEIAWTDKRVVLSCQRPVPIPDEYEYAGCVDDESDDMLDKWAARNGWNMGDPPLSPYVEVGNPGQHILWIANDPNYPMMTMNEGKDTDDKCKELCDSNDKCKTYLNIQTHAHGLCFSSDNTDSARRRPMDSHGNVIKTYMKNPLECNAPYGNPPKNVSGWNYKGCYVDNPDRALPANLGNTSSTEDCIARAKANGFNTIGRQYHGECWAGNGGTFRKYGRAGCCEPMGGAWTQQIYTSQ